VRAERDGDTLFRLGEVGVVDNPANALGVAIQLEREVGERSRDAVEALEEVCSVRHGAE
jgi:hypothetical protein